MSLFSFFSKKPTFPSSINGHIQIKQRYGHKALVVNDVTQSGGELTVMWESVAKTIKKTYSPTTCLLLGLGGGTMVSILQKTFPRLLITCIEIDPVMVTLAKEQFALDSQNTHILTIDAFLYCQQTVGKKTFDLILVDLYIGRFNPPQARTKQFFESLTKLLTPTGRICFNSHFDKRKQVEFETLINICHYFFRDVSVIYTYPLNKILFLRKGTTGKASKQTQQ